MNTDLLKPGLFMKLKALLVPTLASFLKKDSDGKQLFDYTYPRKILGALVIAGGLSIILKKAGTKYLPSKINKQDIKDSDKFRKTLIKTHTPSQQKLWNEINRSQQEISSLTSTIKMSLWNETSSKSTSFDPTEFISTLFLSKKARQLQVKSKWLDLQLTSYETSLNHNQMVLYKNLFETEAKMMSKMKILKTVLSIGLPFLLFHIIGFTQRENLNKWEQELEKAGLKAI